MEKIDYPYPNITEPWRSESICKRKTRSRKIKNNRERNKLSHGGHSDEHEEQESENELMSDDQINSKPIESIDVDPVSHGRVFMPVVEERRETNQLDRLGMEDMIIPSVPDRHLEEEFQEMERELEEELERRNDQILQERTAHQNADGRSGNSGLTVSGTKWMLTVCLSVLCLSQLYDGHG